MLVTLTPEDLTNDLGFSNLQVRKFQQCLDFANSLAIGSGGGADPDTVEALQREIRKLREENANLKAINKELYEDISGSNRTPAPAPPAYAPAPAPSQQQQPHHAAPPHPAGAPVIRGAAGGAARGAVLGAIGGAIAGDPAQGAKMGAAMGAAGGGMQGLAQRRHQRLAGRY
jgi:hypothetical protein